MFCLYQAKKQMEEKLEKFIRENRPLSGMLSCEEPRPVPLDRTESIDTEDYYLARLLGIIIFL